MDNGHRRPVLLSSHSQSLFFYCSMQPPLPPPAPPPPQILSNLRVAGWAMWCGLLILSHALYIRFSSQSCFCFTCGWLDVRSGVGGSFFLLIFLSIPFLSLVSVSHSVICLLAKWLNNPGMAAMVNGAYSLTYSISTVCASGGLVVGVSVSYEIGRVGHI